MRSRHPPEVKAGRDAVIGPSRRPSPRLAITPPPVFTRIRLAAEPPVDGAKMDFSPRNARVPLPWTARFELTPRGFVDRQMRGPFAERLHPITSNRSPATRPQ
jgi:hypothetical protein